MSIYLIIYNLIGLHHIIVCYIYIYIILYNYIYIYIITSFLYISPFLLKNPFIISSLAAALAFQGQGSPGWTSGLWSARTSSSASGVVHVPPGKRPNKIGWDHVDLNVLVISSAWSVWCGIFPWFCRLISPFCRWKTLVCRGFLMFLPAQNRTNCPKEAWTWTGWWLTYPSGKWWSSSVGMMTFPTAWKVIIHSCSKPSTSEISAKLGFVLHEMKMMKPLSLVLMSALSFSFNARNNSCSVSRFARLLHNHPLQRLKKSPNGWLLV